MTKPHAAETLAKQLALVIDLNVCVGCHACVTSCKEWNTSRIRPARWPTSTPTAARAERHLLQPRCRPTRPGSFPDTQTVHLPRAACIAKTRPAFPLPHRASYKRAEDGIVLVGPTSASAASTAAGPALTARAEFDEERKVMTKCTLCVDRI